MTTDWNDLTDSERDALNQAAWDACCGLLRDAARDCPEADYYAVATRRLNDEDAECARLIKRAQRSRATKSDKRSAEYARARSFDISLQQGFLYDVEIDL